MSKLTNQVNVISAVEDAMIAGQHAVVKGIVAGKALKAKKEELKHGEWMPWCKDNLPNIGNRMINNLMKLAEIEPVLEANSQPIANLKRGSRQAPLSWS